MRAASSPNISEPTQEAKDHSPLSPQGGHQNSENLSSIAPDQSSDNIYSCATTVVENGAMYETAMSRADNNDEGHFGTQRKLN